MQPRSMYPSHPLELSVTLLATLSISPNSFCRCAFTHSRSMSHALHSQAFYLSCHYLSRGFTHSCYSLILCAVTSDPVLSHGCYLTLAISHALKLTLRTCSHPKAECMLSLFPSRTPAVVPDQSHRSRRPRFTDKSRGRTCGPQR